MKRAKKILALLLCAVLLVGATIAGTVAYLTDEEAVVNTFTVGNVVITLDEFDFDKDANKDDNVTVGEGDAAVVRDQANRYKLLPGQEYTKDPIIHVDDNSEDCYLFVTVVNQIAAIEDADNTVASQMAAKGWKAVEGVNNTYVYVGTEAGATAPLAVTAGSDITVFEKIVIGESVDNDTLAAYAPDADGNSKTVTVTAYAVQKAGFEDKTAAQIWTAAFGA